jgi:hypothetical protein
MSEGIILHLSIKITNRSNMKQLLCLVCLLSSLIFSASGQNNKKRALEEVERRLTTIYEFVNDIDGDSSLRRVGAVYFLEKLTHIYSESEANDIGKLNPTLADYNLWLHWYQENKSGLYWNKRKKKVMIKQ